MISLPAFFQKTEKALFSGEVPPASARLLGVRSRTSRILKEHLKCYLWKGHTVYVISLSLLYTIQKCVDPSFLVTTTIGDNRGLFHNYALNCA